MAATAWEFRHRALIFGLILGCSFPLYAVDPRNSVAVLANWLEARYALDAVRSARLLWLSAALLLAIAALIRTWASSYLQAEVVYAQRVQSAVLVADGPYRLVRNPLYLANILMAVAMAGMLNRSGGVFAVVAMVLFCQRLIAREEAELRASQGGSYEQYCQAVPRLWPALRPRLPASGRRPRWRAGLAAELWFWGFAAALLAFAVTLSLVVFYVLLGASFFWLFTRTPRPRGNPSEAEWKSD
ncbi:MAG TPA: isoprenylcysteine carboxylmethyltransferase family protein [Steroidobacteraceae bacterium]|nr:isoprenylcysteine carboxylmethyltransferase family protein [Steroidobacteraceae bacterium]